MSQCLGDKCDYCLKKRVELRKKKEQEEKERKAMIDKYLPKKKL